MKLNDNEIMNVINCEEEKDLGVIFDCKLSFDAHVQCVISKANRNIGIIIRTFSYLKMPSKLIRILRITFCYKQLCGRCLVHMTPVVKVVIHCVFALL